MVTPYSYPFRRPFDRAPAGSPTKTVTGIPRREANFDTNMVIILAALLCALIFTLGLNSIIRCALRCRRGFVGRRNDEEAVGRRSGDTGMKKRALRQMPVTVYGSVENVIPTTDCPICLGEFVEGEKLRVLPKCNHGFHVRCIDTWLLSHSSCPNCRHSLLEPAVAAASVDAGVQSPGTRNESDDNGVVVIVNNMS